MAALCFVWACPLAGGATRATSPRRPLRTRPRGRPGVEEFDVSPSHTPPDARVNYPQIPQSEGLTTPPGRRAPSMTNRCHWRRPSIRWSTVRSGSPICPDVLQDDIQRLRELSRTRDKVLLSRWDWALPLRSLCHRGDASSSWSQRTIPGWSSSLKHSLGWPPSPTLRVTRPGQCSSHRRPAGAPTGPRQVRSLGRLGFNRRLQHQLYALADPVDVAVGAQRDDQLGHVSRSPASSFSSFGRKAEDLPMAPVGGGYAPLPRPSAGERQHARPTAVAATYSGDPIAPLRELASARSFARS